MADHYKTQGFVLHREDRLEADRIFSVFTRDFGRIEIFAKAIRKIDAKLKGGIEIFSFSEIEFIQGRHKKTLTDALFLENCKIVASDPEKFEVAGKISSTVEHFVKGSEADEQIWNLLKEVFEKLNSQDFARNKLLYYYFFWNFIAVLGYQPQLFACAMCHQPLHHQHLYFSCKEGGLLCQECAIKEPVAKKINADAVKILRLMLEKNWSILSKVTMAPASKKIVKEISDWQYRYLLDSVAHTQAPQHL